MRSQHHEVLRHARLCQSGGFCQRGYGALAASEFFQKLNSSGVCQSSEKLGEFASGEEAVRHGVVSLQKSLRR